MGAQLDLAKVQLTEINIILDIRSSVTEINILDTRSSICPVERERAKETKQNQQAVKCGD